AMTVQYPGTKGVLPGYGHQNPNDWGLGFEIRDGKSPHWTGSASSPRTFGHFGQSGTFLWIDPDAGLACAALADLAFGPWAGGAGPPCAAAVRREARGCGGAARRPRAKSGRGRPSAGATFRLHATRRGPPWRPGTRARAGWTCCSTSSTRPGRWRRYV